jgi:hypothetical protein
MKVASLTTNAFHATYAICGNAESHNSESVKSFILQVGHSQKSMVGNVTACRQ